MELRNRWVKCIVPGCGKNRKDNPDLIFLTFPSNANRFNKWKEVLKLEDIKKHSENRCCELHFDLPNDAENWMYYKTAGARIVLKNEVVPHINLESTPIHYKSQLTDSAKKRKSAFIKKVEDLASRKRLFVDCDNIEEASTSKLPALVSIDDNEVQFAVETSFSSETASGSSSCVHEIVSSDSSASELHEADRKAEQERQLKTTLNVIEMDSRFYLGLPKDIYFLIIHLAKWSHVAERNILLTFKKIHLADQNKHLAYDFGLSESMVSKIFTSVTKLSNIMQLNIYWPTSTIIQLNLPIPFRYRYSKVESIIDCLEVEIEKPSDDLQQALTWSEYKKCNTLKFLVSCIPNGMINYISGAFGGRITDQRIIKESDYLLKMKNDVDVMADRGFKNIDDLLLIKNCRLVRPPSLSAKEPHTKKQVKESKRIAALRIHVERVIRRIREFEMMGMHSCIHHSNIRYINDIAIIASALVNLQGPLIK